MLTDSVSENGWKQTDICKIVILFLNLTDLCLEDDPFFLSSWIRTFHQWKNTPFFAKMGTSTDIALTGRGVLPVRIQSICWNITFNSSCALFVLSLCRRCYRIDEVSWAILPGDTVTSIFCGNHGGHKYNWPKPNHMYNSCDAPCIIPAVVG